MPDRQAGSYPPASPLAVTFVAALALSACAGGPPGIGRGPGPDGPAAPALFISPFGEPFVAGANQPWPMADWFRGTDADLDGGVTFEEFTTDGARWFGRLDTDRDGRLNPYELAAYETSLRGFGSGPRGPGALGRPGGGPPGGGGPRRPGGGAAENLASGATQQGPGGGPPRGGPPGAGGPRRPQAYGIIAEAGFFNLPQPVKAADVNVDQRVTAAEWATATQRWFLALDTDRDGRLTLATLLKTPLQQRAEARRR